MKISNIHKVCFLALLSPCLMAQVPYEFFEIHEITPANEPDAGISQRPVQPAPEALYIDTNTGIGGNLSLFEPFAPPVGVYKRVNILTKPVLTNQRLFYIQDPIGKCKLADTHTKYTPNDIHRSALIDLDLSQTPVRLPGDSPEMKLTGFKATPLDDTENSTVKLILCDSENYYVTTDKPGKYRIEYEVASPGDSAVPKPAAFFISVKPHAVEIDSEIADMVNLLVSKFPELVSIRSNPQSLSQLITFFQSFETNPLSDTPQQDSTAENFSGGMGADIMFRILSEKKGICRHRAFLFALIAQTWGYHVRIVVNEVHAFVEIQVKDRWYPIELGGRAQSLTVHSNSQTAPVTLKRDISFLDEDMVPGNVQNQEAGKSQNGQILPADAQSRHVGNSGRMGQINGMMRDENDDVQIMLDDSVEVPNAPQNTWTRTQFKYLPLNFPSSVIRDKPKEISGVMVDNRDIPLAYTRFRLIIQNPFRQPLISEEIQTDEKGAFSIQIQLPPDWPVGNSRIQWQMLDNRQTP